MHAMFTSETVVNNTRHQPAYAWKSNVHTMFASIFVLHFDLCTLASSTNLHANIYNIHGLVFTAA
eukprot:1583783-Amphidinium_carterae.1